MSCGELYGEKTAPVDYQAALSVDSFIPPGTKLGTKQRQGLEEQISMHRVTFGLSLGSKDYWNIWNYTTLELGVEQKNFCPTNLEVPWHFGPM